MKIFDCFMFYDENLCLDIRLNTLDKYVDYFIIVEASYSHNGEKRKLKFNINNFKKFKKKIRYIVLNKLPVDIIKKSKKFNDEQIKVLNAIKRENFQRDYILEGLYDAKAEDIIIISDVDEIPNLSQVNFAKIKTKKIYIFKQLFFYYKLNLVNIYQYWYGTKMCKFDYFQSPQWLRNIKPKKYNFLRVDTWFNNKKYQNVDIFHDGGWHFSYVKTPNLIQKKLRTYLHHQEYDANPLSINKIKNIIKSNKIIYDLSLDQKASNKFKTGKKLEKISLNKLPVYIKKNVNKFKNWLA